MSGGDERDQGLPVEPYPIDREELAATIADGSPRLSIYRPERAMVVLGSGSRVDLELHAERCLADRVPLFRRPGGGCSVVLDPGNLIVSLFLPDPKSAGVRSAFRTITNWMIDRLAQSGVSAVTQQGTSDLTLDGRKIGGSCIYKPRGAIYYSTTLLVEPDLELLDRYLKHPPREPDYRARRSHREFVLPLSTRGWSTAGLAERLQLAARGGLPAV